MTRVAIIAGSSGLVGHALLRQLCDDPSYEKIISLVRSPGKYNHEKIEEIIIDFDRLALFEHKLKGDILFSCLGTTRNKTPDRSSYYRIDHDYPVQLAALAQKNGVEQVHIISSIAANAASGSFYIRMKGETERDIAAIPFRSVHIYRPSFLSGNREEKRLLEQWGLKVFRMVRPLLTGRFKKYRSIDAAVVARAMVRNAAGNSQGINIYESDIIQDIGS